MADNDLRKRIMAADDSDDSDSFIFNYLLKPDSTIIERLEAYKAADTSSAVNASDTSSAVNASVDFDKGMVVGRLSFCEDGETIDCTRWVMGPVMGIGIPENIDRVADMKSDALFILLVEKHFTYMRLKEEKFYNRFPCIIVRARQPDVATLHFLIKMKVELKLPVLALVDSDPFGVYILSVFSRSMPDIKWLGVWPSDLDKYKIPEKCRQPMTEKDIKYVKALLKGDYVKKNPERVKELNLMMESKYKAECEELCSLGLRYLTEVYLPLKLQEMDWL